MPSNDTGCVVPAEFHLPLDDKLGTGFASRTAGDVSTKYDGIITSNFAPKSERSASVPKFALPKEDRPKFNKPRARSSRLLGRHEFVAVRWSGAGTWPGLLFDRKLAPAGTTGNSAQQRYRRQQTVICNHRGCGHCRLDRSVVPVSSHWASSSGTMDLNRADWSGDLRSYPQLRPGNFSPLGALILYSTASVRQSAGTDSPT